MFWKNIKIEIFYACVWSEIIVFLNVRIIDD